MSIINTIILTIALTTGCAALQSLNEVRKDLCDILGEQQEAQIQSDADRAGIGFAEALAIWKTSCLIRMQRAEAQAVSAGSAAIRTERR